MKKTDRAASPDCIKTYFLREWLPLLAVTVTGILCNGGLIAGPWFEGQLAQTLSDIIGGNKIFTDILPLALFYVLVIATVQALRYTKRYYVRRFANNVSRSMKRVLYRNLIHKSKLELDKENVGTLMTKAISDVDACAEGMRKFTTEVFDTGVVMVAYLVMLFCYDWRLALLSSVFPPLAFLIADRLKKPVSRCAAQYKESAGRLNGETLDRISGALTYRVLSVEPQRDAAYEARLEDYEKKAVRAGILETTMQPLYQILSMTSVVCILYFGARNVRGAGWVSWNIAAFITFLSCFAKLAVKSSKAAKLFNAVQKARVSWQRIKPLMREVQPDAETAVQSPCNLTVAHLSFAYPNGQPVLNDISFTAEPGQIIGITGPIACGKSTLGKAFLCEHAYSGSIRFGNQELANMEPSVRSGMLSYMGHDPELISDTVEENVLLGEAGDAARFLQAVCLDGEVHALPAGMQTRIGSGGVRLSGGQQSRLALARTLANRKPLLVLDDPFSALDRKTEAHIMESLRIIARDSIVLLISHRLYAFPTLDKVIWMENGRAVESTHAALMQTNTAYRELFHAHSEEAQA